MHIMLTLVDVILPRFSTTLEWLKQEGGVKAQGP